MWINMSNVLVNQWSVSEGLNKQMDERMNWWMTGWMTDWMKYWTNNLLNEWVDGKCIYEFELVNEWVKEKMKKWMNGWIIMCISELVLTKLNRLISW